MLAMEVDKWQFYITVEPLFCLLNEYYHEKSIFFSEYICSFRAMSGIVHAHHSCGGKTGKVVWVPSFDDFQYSFQKRLCQINISAFS